MIHVLLPITLSPPYFPKVNFDWTHAVKIKKGAVLSWGRMIGFLKVIFMFSFLIPFRTPSGASKVIYSPISA